MVRAAQTQELGVPYASAGPSRAHCPIARYETGSSGDRSTTTPGVASGCEEGLKMTKRRGGRRRRLREGASIAPDIRDPGKVTP